MPPIFEHCVQHLVPLQSEYISCFKAVKIRLCVEISFLRKYNPWPLGLDTRLEFYPPARGGGLLRLPPKLRRKDPKTIPGNNEAS